MKPLTATALLTQLVTRLLKMAVGVTLACILSACSRGKPPADDSTLPLQAADAPVQRKPDLAAKKAEVNYKTIEWTDLIPEDDLEALLEPPEDLDEIEDGTEADQLDSQTLSTFAEQGEGRYYEALASTRIIEAFDNRDVRIPGFIVPLEFDDALTVTEFFLVPYFGACIHLPPPPPNQVIHVTLDEGIKMEVLYDPFWVTGTLRTSIVENDVAKAAYTMRATGITPYDDFVETP